MTLIPTHHQVWNSKKKIYLQQQHKIIKNKNNKQKQNILFYLKYKRWSNDNQCFWVVFWHLSLIHWNPTVVLSLTFFTPVVAADFVFPSPSPTFFPYFAAAPPPLFFFSGTGSELLSHWSAHDPPSILDFWFDFRTFFARNIKREGQRKYGKRKKLINEICWVWKMILWWFIDFVPNKGRRVWSNLAFVYRVNVCSVWKYKNAPILISEISF